MLLLYANLGYEIGLYFTVALWMIVAGFSMVRASSQQFKAFYVFDGKKLHAFKVSRLLSYWYNPDNSSFAFFLTHCSVLPTLLQNEDVFFFHLISVYRLLRLDRLKSDLRESFGHSYSICYATFVNWWCCSFLSIYRVEKEIVL